MKQYYLLGAGGIGMSALGLALRQRHIPVYGSDCTWNANVAQLVSRGACIDVPEDPEKLTKQMTLVFSSDIPQEHPVFLKARALKVPILHRSDLLAQMIAPFKQIVVTGTHGKTTTTSLLLHLLSFAGKNPAYFVGSHLKGYLHGYMGSGSYAVVEGDESDGSFLKTSPLHAIITNIDDDHLNFWKSWDNLKKGFDQFFHQVAGPLWICGDDPGIMQMGWKGLTYGYGKHNQLVIEPLKIASSGSYARFHYDNRSYSCKSPLIGRHNLLNTAAVFGMGLLLDIDPEQIQKAIASFCAPERRQQYLGQREGIDVYSDYAHHPGEVYQTLAAFRESFPEKRICVLFQPHRYSRLKECWHGFTQAFNASDLLFITDIYASSEKPIEGVTVEAFVMQLQAHAAYIAIEQIGQIYSYLKPGDLLIAMGAGSIDALIKQSLEKGLLSSNQEKERALN